MVLYYAKFEASVLHSSCEIFDKKLKMDKLFAYLGLWIEWRKKKTKKKEIKKIVLNWNNISSNCLPVNILWTKSIHQLLRTFIFVFT